MVLVKINCVTVFWQWATSLWIFQVCVEVAIHHQLSPVGPSADGLEDVIYGQDVVEGDVAPHGIPLIPYHLQMGGEYVWAVEVEILKGEVLRLAVEYGPAALARDCRLGCYGLVPSRLSRVNPL